LAASILAVVLGMIFLAGIADAPGLATAPTVAVAADDMDYGAVPSELYPAVPGLLSEKSPPAYEAMRAAESLVETFEAEFQAINQAQGLTTTFMSSGIQITPFDGQDGTWTHSLRLEGYGYGDQIQSVPVASLAPEGPRIEYRYGAADSDLAPAMTE
jgi:hypothetical protein